MTRFLHERQPPDERRRLSLAQAARAIDAGVDRGADYKKMRAHCNNFCDRWFTTARADMASAPSDQAIESAIEALLASRASTSSICPSDAARALAPAGAADEWRPWMPQIRRVAATMAQQGRLRITQGEREIDPRALAHDEVCGPIRLRRLR